MKARAGPLFSIPECSANELVVRSRGFGCENDAQRIVRQIRQIDWYEIHAELPQYIEGRIVEFTGLAWDPRCLDFSRTERPVRTLSQSQVRQPLFTSSIGRWRHYEKHLQPLKDALA